MVDESEASARPGKAEVADMVALHVCLNRCHGQTGVAAGCCRLDARDYILGPIPDAAALLERLSAHLGRPVEHDEVFIDFEEGSALFPERPCWQQPACYPALRVDLEQAGLPCRFLGENQLCTIHAIRSVTCRNYFCGHLKTVLDAL